MYIWGSFFITHETISFIYYFYNMKKIILSIISLICIENIGHSQCYSAGENLPKSGFIMTSSGHADLDMFVFQEILDLEKFFGVDLDFFFLLEDYDKNAMYTPSCNQNCQGTVFLGVKMLYSELIKENGGYVLKAILAHEFGHCIQHLDNWKEPGKRPELFCDFISGYYMGKQYNLSEQELNTLFESFFSMGDNMYWSNDHHGTGTERKCSFLEGFYYAKESFASKDKAAKYAYDYVKAENPCGIRKYKALETMLNNDANKSAAIRNKNYGNRFIRDLSITDYDPVRVTYTCTDNYFYVISAPGIGECGTVSKDNDLTLIMDRNTTYKMMINQCRKNIFGKIGSLKSSRWETIYSPNKDSKINVTRK